MSQTRNFEITSGNYTYLPIDRVYFGPGEIQHLTVELDRLDSKKPFIVTGETIAKKTQLLSKIESALGRPIVGIFHGITQHAPFSTISQARDEVERTKADCLISLGGGSPIDSAKIIVKDLSHNFHKPSIPHIAIPTTLSAAEFSHSAGFTDETTHRKSGVRDVRMTPRVVFLDPELTLETPRWLWASSGIRSLDHAVEAICSPKHQLYVDTLALKAISLLFENLTDSKKDPLDLKAAMACQMAAWMSYAGALSVGTGLSHAIGRVIGASWNIPHGITSCITLSEVMREQAKTNPEPLAIIAIAEDLKISKQSLLEQALLAADGVKNLIARLGLTKRLGDYGITARDLPAIAREVSSGENNEATVLRILESIL